MKIDIITLIQTLIAGGIGASIKPLFDFILGKSKQKDDNQNTIFTRIDEDNTRLRIREKELDDEVDVLRKKISVLEKSFESLRIQFSLLKQADAMNPFATLIEDMEGKVVMLNSEYQTRILDPLSLNGASYFGITSFEFWGEELGKEYRRTTNYVLSTKNMIDIMAPIKTPKGIENWRVIKQPVHLSNTDIMVGVKVIWIHPME